MNTALKWIGGAIGVVVLALALYAGAYYATVQKGPNLASFPFWAPRYRFGGDTFFTPIHELDRRFRHEHWEFLPMEAVR